MDHETVRRMNVGRLVGVEKRGEESGPREKLALGGCFGFKDDQNAERCCSVQCQSRDEQPRRRECIFNESGWRGQTPFHRNRLETATGAT